MTEEEVMLVIRQMQPDQLRASLRGLTRQERIILGMRCDVDWLVIELSQEVACPFCDAPPDEPCGATGPNLLDRVHRDRLRAAYRCDAEEC